MICNLTRSIALSKGSVFETGFNPNNWIYARDAPINLPRSGGKSKFPRHTALFSEKRTMDRVLRAFSPDFLC